MISIGQRLLFDSDDLDDCEFLDQPFHSLSISHGQALTIVDSLSDHVIYLVIFNDMAIKDSKIGMAYGPEIKSVEEDEVDSLTQEEVQELPDTSYTDDEIVLIDDDIIIDDERQISRDRIKGSSPSLKKSKMIEVLID
ncbi:hypothetical protein GEMRC1_010496 [Eukaryota sp. GEM-RC1]